MSKPLTLMRLPEDLARFAEAQVASGRYPDVDGVVEASLAAMRRYQEKVANLEAALEEGERSGDADDGVFERLRARIRRSASR